MNSWLPLPLLRPALITPIRPETQWIAVVNPQAGDFQAMAIASAVQNEVGRRMVIYETHEDPVRRLKDITALIAERRPSLANPLGVIGFGGDKTGSDAVRGVMHYLFPQLSDLWKESPRLVSERMLAGGIMAGVLPLGGANDNGGIYGAPKLKASDKNASKKALKFMDDALMTSLNLGVAFLGDEQRPEVFCHSISAGETIAPVYEKTVEERGIKAKRHRERLFVGNAWAHRSFNAQWRDASGEIMSEQILEILIHSVVRADERMGLPGTPQPGLGVKIFPAKGRWNTLRMFREVLWRGIKSRNGDPTGLRPEDRLSNIPEHLQQPLHVGALREFFFRGPDDLPFATAIQAEGDFSVRTHRLGIYVPPPYPYYMVASGALMANLHGRQNQP
jgi:hypothetical protein